MYFNGLLAGTDGHNPVSQIEYLSTLQETQVANEVIRKRNIGQSTESASLTTQDAANKKVRKKRPTSKVWLDFTKTELENGEKKLSAIIVA